MTNEYDKEPFFQQYAKMPRSVAGLDAAGEWHQLRPLFPDLKGKRVLDLGCGYGWHCRYALEQGAEEVMGIDLSEKMIAQARAFDREPAICYRVCGIEEYEYPSDRWDCVISNLALHYIADLDSVFRQVYRTLKSGGVFIMNIEHPVFTAGVRQEWIYKADGTPDFWPLDRYFYPGPRHTQFCGCEVTKQHHTLTQILMGLLANGFRLEVVEEAQPPEEMMEQPGMKDEMRRPMMLLVKAVAEKSDAWMNQGRGGENG